MSAFKKPIAVPKQEVALRAYNKWNARSHAGDLQLHDWLEAEADLRHVSDLARQLAEVEVRLADRFAHGKLAESRLAVEHAIGEILSASADFSDAASPILGALCECLGWDVGALWLVDRSANVLRCLDLWHQSAIEVPAFERATRQQTFSPGEGIPGRVWADGTLIWVPDVTVDANFPRGPVAAKEGLHGAVGFPIRNGTDHLGSMEFFSREIRYPDDELIQMMTRISRHISQFIERRHAEKELRIQEEDRRIARLIQQGLLPKRMPALPGFTIRGRSSTANTVGGDYFDFIPLLVGDQESLCVVVGDASGHGIGAALMIAETRAYLRALALTCSDVGALLSLTNRRFASDIVSDHFVTLFLMCLSPRPAYQLLYTSAGHWPGYVLDRRGQTKAILPSTGVPLGINPEQEYSVPPALFLEPGELILLVTDGIVEAMSSDGKAFGLERTLGIVRAHQQETPDEILESLFDALADFCEGKFQDDLTAVVIKAES